MTKTFLTNQSTGVGPSPLTLAGSETFLILGLPDALEFKPIQQARALQHRAFQRPSRDSPLPRIEEGTPPDHIVSGYTPEHSPR